MAMTMNEHGRKLQNLGRKNCETYVNIENHCKYIDRIRICNKCSIQFSCLYRIIFHIRLTTTQAEIRFLGIGQFSIQHFLKKNSCGFLSFLIFSKLHQDLDLNHEDTSGTFRIYFWRTFRSI